MGVNASRDYPPASLPLCEQLQEVLGLLGQIHFGLGRGRTTLLESAVGSEEGHNLHHLSH